MIRRHLRPMKTPTPASPRRRSVSDRSLSVWSVCVARPVFIHLSPSVVRPCPSVCPSVRPSVCLSVCLSVRPSVCLSVRQFVHINPSVYLSVRRLDILYSAGSLASRLHLISWSASAVVPPASVSLEATPLSWAPSLQSLVQCGHYATLAAGDGVSEGWVVSLAPPPPPPGLKSSSRQPAVLPASDVLRGFLGLSAPRAVRLPQIVFCPSRGGVRA